MKSRLKELDHDYGRRMLVTLPLSLGLILTVLLTFPAYEQTVQNNLRVAQSGPMRLLPELDIITDDPDDTHRRAAPVAILPSDFVAIDFVYEVVDLAEPIPTPNPEASTGDSPVPVHTIDDIQDYIRTTSLPVLAETDVEVLHIERPIYPAQAVKMNVEGTVEVMLLVDERGMVASAHVVPRNRIPFLEDAARDAAQQYRFKPYLVKGEATAFWVKVPFLFRLI